MFYAKPKLICYDFDETLVSSKEVYKKSLNLLCEKYGIRKRTDEEMDIINKACFKDVLSALFGEENEQNIHQEYEFGYAMYSRQLCHPIFGSFEFVQTSKENGILQAIISNKPNNIVEQEVDRIGFGKYIDVVIGSSYGFKKPDKEILDIIVEKLNIDKQVLDTIWMFGDSIPDVEFAKNINAKMFFVGDKNLLSNDLKSFVVPNWTSFYDIHFMEDGIKNKNNKECKTLSN